MTIERDVPVKMRDGTVLRTDVYRPAEGGPFPTLVHRLPYNKSHARSAATYMLNPLNAGDRGYAVVVQDVRGRFNSDGEWVPFRDDADDGYDTVEWCAGQPWCDGKVGIYGSSYMGVTTWQAVVSAPPHLEAAFAYVTGSDYHEGWTYSGGAFELGFNLWWILGLAADKLTKIPAERIPQARNRLLEALTNVRDTQFFLPLSELPVLEDLAPYYKEWLKHPAYDEYWRGVSVAERLDKITIPVLQMTGWYDNFLVGHLVNYAGVKERAATDRARRQQKLVVGPWTHEHYMGPTPTKSGEIDFGPLAAPNAEPLVFRWFDYWLKGIDTGIAGEPPVRIYTTGANAWRDESDWPLARAQATPYYLHGQGRANSLHGDGDLSLDLPESEPPDTFVYDPADPVPTIGGRLLMPHAVNAGVFDQRPVEERRDVLAYTSGELSADREVTGPILVKLWASTTAPDTDFTAKLVDVHPDGYAAILAEGIIRARFRESLSQAKLLNPGEVCEYAIDLWAISHLFKAGHRIRLEISSSNFPRFDRNLNTGLGPDSATIQTAVQIVYHDVHRPSCIILPVVPS